MKLVRYFYFAAFFILSAALLYFPYYLATRPQAPLTNDIDKINKLAKELIAYDTLDIKLFRHGRKGDAGYIVPDKALEAAGILLGYGIDEDNSFEDEFSLKYNKPCFGFDCGISNIASKSKLFTFVPHCIGKADTIYENQTSSGKVSPFSEQLDFLDLKDKKLFIKMDIEGAEYSVFDDILSHSDQITAIVMELHMRKGGAE